ncbi:MAG: alpha/beta fold hydrolase [Hyphomicrobiaceae bacterium]
MDTLKISASGLAYETTDLVAPWSQGQPPIVFHHGIGTDHNVWSDWLPHVVTRHRCLRFDTRGFGRSAVPPDDHAFTLESCLEDILEMMELAGPGPVHLVGESFGGTMVLLAALRHPEKVATVTISNTAYKGSGIQYVAGWREAFTRQGVPAWSADMMTKRFHDDALEHGKRAWFQSTQDASPAHVTAGLGELLARTDLTAELGRLKPPLLILMPDRSPFVTARMAVELSELVPAADLAMFPGARHGLPFSHGSDCGTRLRQHLDTWAMAGCAGGVRSTDPAS